MGCGQSQQVSWGVSPSKVAVSRQFKLISDWGYDVSVLQQEDKQIELHFRGLLRSTLLARPLKTQVYIHHVAYSPFHNVTFIEEK